MTNPFKALRHRAKKDPLLWRTGACFLVICFLMVIGSHNHVIESNHALIAEVLRELGIAICISVFIAALIEIGLARKTFEKGLDAIMKQTVPEEVWDEIKQHVISQPVLRYDWTITMNIRLTEGSGYVSTTTVTYGIKSLRDFLTHEVHHEVDAPRVVNRQQPFKWIKVAGSEKNLKEIVKGNGADFPIEFPEENQCKIVELCFEERVRENDVITWWMTIATQMLTVDVYVPPEWRVEVHAHHPEKKILQPAKMSNSRWECKGVMLPGQGFEIRLSHGTDLGGANVPAVPSETSGPA